MGLVFKMSMALRLNHQLINIEDGSLLKSLQVVLANLGILGTTPPGILPMRMFQITRMDQFNEIPGIRDIHVEAQQKSFIPPLSAGSRNVLRPYGFPA